VDWGSTVAYKDRFGISISEHVSSERYEKTREGIIRKLRALRDGHGNRVMRLVCAREDLYKGRFVQDVPDIITVSEGRYSIDPASRPSKAVFSGEAKTTTTGSHNSDNRGIFIAYGPDIKQGGEITGISILDITPTILQMLGVPLSSEMDGRVLHEIFSPGSGPAKAAVRYLDGEEGTKRKGKGEAISEDDEEKVKERLKALGYLD
jgi:predicted AlkP superfamily phosphohydrolase/phosphomutase